MERFSCPIFLHSNESVGRTTGKEKFFLPMDANRTGLCLHREWLKEVQPVSGVDNGTACHDDEAFRPLPPPFCLILRRWPS